MARHPFPSHHFAFGSRKDRKMRQNRFHPVFDRFCPFIADTAGEKTCRSRALADHAVQPPLKNGENGGNSRTMRRRALRLLGVGKKMRKGAEKPVVAPSSRAHAGENLEK